MKAKKERKWFNPPTGEEQTHICNNKVWKTSSLVQYSCYCRGSEGRPGKDTQTVATHKVTAILLSGNCD